MGVSRPSAVLLGSLVAVALLGVGALYFSYDPAEVGFFPRCPLFALTGYRCAGCGSQRAIHALLHLELTSAWQLNPLLVAALPYVALGFLTERMSRHRIAWTRFRKTLYGQQAIWVVLGVVIAFTVGRNL